MSTKNIALSAASIASAISAIGIIGENGGKIHISSEQTAKEEAAAAAVATTQAQQYIRRSAEPIARTIMMDGELLSEKYFRIALVPDTDPRLSEGALNTDSTIDWIYGVYGNGVYTENGVQKGDPAPDGFSCYSNCHIACHGSRSWR